MAHLHLRLFGPFAAQLNGVRLQFAYSKQAALLAYLAMAQGQLVPRRMLGLLLWPDKSSDAIQVNLRKVISSLRKLLHDDHAPMSLLLVEDDTLRLNPQLDLWLDVTAFQALLGSCAGHRHRHATNCTACYVARRQACELYAGDFLADLSLDDSDTFDEWVVNCRESLRLQALAALQALAMYSLQRGRTLEAYAEVQRLLRVEPLHEEGNQLAIVTLAGLGQFGSAAAHYEQYRRLLLREIGAAPPAATERMAVALRVGEMPVYGPLAGLTARADKPISPELSNLEPLIGRTVEVDELNAWLNDPTRRLITITGMGGVGKTHLVATVAQEQSRVFRNGIVYIPLAEVPSASQFRSTLCQALSARMAEGREPLHQAAVHIGDQDMLLVLDRFDHLLDARRDLAHLLQACPNLVILLTSRVRLGMAGEWVFRLGGLDAPPAEMDASINAYSAANLFLHAAQQARPDLAVDEVNRAAVAEICRLVQGLPLALVLLAAWVRVLPCVELLEELRRSIDVVRSTHSTGDAQQISLRSVLEQSWHSLRAEERSVLAALSVFHGGFDRKAAGLVADADLDVLSSLVDHSLLQVSGEGRYSWHELVQQFCAEKLESSGQQEHMAGRHFAYFLAEAETNAAELASLRNLAAFLWFGCERANLQAAVDWASSSPKGHALYDHKRLAAAIDSAGYRKGVHISP